MNKSRIKEPEISALCTLQFALCTLLGLSLAVASTTAAPADTTALQPARAYAGKYILASLVLPGAGEMWKNAQPKGEAFMWTDAAIWVTYAGLEIAGNARNQSAKLFARQYSGASSTIPGDEYYVNLERYANSDQYNEDVRRDAREMFPDDPVKQKQYSDAHSYTGNKTWNWGSDSLRFAYWNVRRDARSALHTGAFFLGAALLNRLVSAVDVAFFTETSSETRIGTRPPPPDPRPPSFSSLSSRLSFAPTLDRPGLALVVRF